MPRGIYKRTKYHLEISRKMGRQNFKEKAPWNKGKHIQSNDALKKWRESGGQPWNKGNHVRLNNALEKWHKNGGQVWNKGKKCPERSGKKHPYWKGGKTIDKSGYVCIHQSIHPFRDNKNYVREHRLVIERQIGRYLLPEEQSHHLNKIKDDNRPQNLMAFINNSAHQRFHKDPHNVKPSEIIFDGRKINHI